MTTSTKKTRSDSVANARMNDTLTIINEPTGAVLRETRERLSLTRDEVAVRTNIPLSYVGLLEDGGNATGSGMDAYTRIYLKAYAKFLGLDAAAMMTAFAAETARARQMHRPASTRRHPITAVSGKEMASAPRIIRRVIGVLVVGAVIAFFGSQLVKLVSPPSITILSPKDGMVTSDPTVAIEGRTEHEVSLTINGKPVNVDGDGRFTDSMDLREGVNLIRVIGTRKHSKEMIVERRVIVQPKERKAAVLDEQMFELPHRP